MIENQNYTLGRGELYFDDGSGERYIGNSPEFTLSTATENLEHYSSDHGLRNRDRNIVTQITYSGSFSTDHISPENLAMLFMGSTSVLSQASVTGATDSFDGIKQGLWYQLGTTDASPAGARNVSNVVITGATEGTDYELDATLGRIQVLPGSTALTDDSTLSVTYDIAAASRSQVVSGSSQVTGKFRYVSYNPENAGEQRDFFMPSVTLSANGDFALKAESDWQTIPFTLEISKTETLEAVYADGRPYTP